MWLLFALSGPVLWAASTHIDKYLVDRYFKNSDTAVLMVFTALIGVDEGIRGRSHVRLVIEGDGKELFAAEFNNGEKPREVRIIEKGGLHVAEPLEESAPLTNAEVERTRRLLRERPV